MKTHANLSISVLIVLLSTAFIIYSCKKEVVKVIPTITITTVTDITANSATSGGNITLDGGAPITSRGVCSSLSQNPTTADTKTSNGAGIGSFTSSIIGLTPGATYYIKAYAINSVGTAYSSQSTFTTLSVAPVLTTTDISGITATSAISGGNTTSEGGASITSRGICWSLNQNPTIADSITSDGTGTGIYTSSIRSLTPGATYYVKAYATNNAGTGYGNQVTFKTLSVAPVLTTTNISALTSTSASSGGNIVSDGGAAVTARGVCWSTNENPTIADNKTNNGTGTGVYTSSITGLTPGSTYYIRAYATNSIGTAYGNQISTTTVAVLPTLTTTTVTAIASTTATSGGNITNDGGAAVTVRGVCWSTSQNPTTTDSKTTDGTGTGIFISSITGLTPGTTYYIKAYATNSIGTTYGSQITFTTISMAPVLATSDISAITSTTANSGGNITSDGGAPITSRGVCWGTSSDPSTTNNKTNNGIGVGIFTSSITGLTPGTTYYVRAYATNSKGTSYGNQLLFNTSATLPTITTAAISDITPANAKGGGTINSDGGAPIIARGVCWSINQNPTIADSLTIDGTGLGSFTSDLVNLLETTPYYARAYATNSAGTAYGNSVTFSITTRSVESDYKPLGLIPMTLEEMLSIPTVEASNPLPLQSLKSSQSDPVDIKLPSPGSQYFGSCVGWAVGYGMMSTLYRQIEGYEDYNEDDHNRIFSPYYIWNQLNHNNDQGIKILDAINLIMEQGCCKLSNMPAIPEVVFEPNAAAKANAVNYKLTSFYRFETFDLNRFKYFLDMGSPLVISINIDNAFGKFDNHQFEEINGKLVWKSYHRKLFEKLGEHAVLVCDYDDNIQAVKIFNSWGSKWGTGGYAWIDYDFLKEAVVHGNGPSFYEIFVGFVRRPVLSTNEITEISENTAKSGGTITKNWSNSVTERGVCWSTSSDPTTSDNKNTDAIGGTGTFTSTITGLSPNTKYYLKAYAINANGKSYGYQKTFTTTQGTTISTPTVTNTAATAITSTSATVGGNVTSSGGANITEKGVYWGTSANPESTGTKKAIASGTDSFSASLTELSPNTTYYVKAYAINSQGTGYASNTISFTTTASAIQIGQSYQGGIIFYIDNTGQHGLIAAPTDQSTSIKWYNGTYKVTGASGTKLGTGRTNTTAIVNSLGTGNYAAILCDQLVLNGYADWFLPSREELNYLFNLNSVYGLSNNNYWSSSESGGSGWGAGAWYRSISTNAYGDENRFCYVRAIRAF